MFISKKLVFTELHKTGCSHIGKILGALLEGIQKGKHNRPPENILEGDYYFLGSVRNPWDWYVSLWSYGCGQAGSMYLATVVGNKTPRRFTGRGWKINPLAASKSYVKDLFKDHERWQRCYAEQTPENFQEWLRVINDEEFWGDFGEDYDQYPANQSIGLLTYRYLRLFCRSDFRNLKDFSEICQFAKDNCYIDYFIKNESLEADLAIALQNCGLFTDELSLVEKLKSFGRTNTSPRKKDYLYYYDQNSINLITQREKLIIEKFNYQPPKINVSHDKIN
ncbi:sulfotransferase family 2 domain-containing protein [[Limnothrix rosea] IAM M-220]|uniref:sulfotransferase family 2 domain-containing protein n=1 Tax=[Limnothrix rosea] IAM M-220 TaxID=454133 RepID=UPI00096A0666|nr:sulfotransferase family 2 domain-containing protein [[Limnothrix rosea] IAM M-220]OKH15164.1 hypothetical protein NIES208_12865 [[Limnothrix rosea] IAM M-220]